MCGLLGIDFVRANVLEMQDGVVTGGGRADMGRYL